MMKMWEREELRETRLEKLIKKYGFESEPVIYFTKWAWKDIYNQDRYYEVAIGWIFFED